jgi:hypothetical protein
MPEERTVKKMCKNIPEERRSVGKPRKRWLDGVENGQKKMAVRGWRKIARNGDAWKLILKEAKYPAWTVELVEKERERERRHFSSAQW